MIPSQLTYSVFIKDTPHVLWGDLLCSWHPRELQNSSFYAIHLSECTSVTAGQFVQLPSITGKMFPTFPVLSAPFSTITASEPCSLLSNGSPWQPHVTLLLITSTFFAYC